jgi:hypothetical protein
VGTSSCCSEHSSREMCSKWADEVVVKVVITPSLGKKAAARCAPAVVSMRSQLLEAAACDDGCCGIALQPSSSCGNVVHSSQVDTTCCELPWKVEGGRHDVEEERDSGAVGGAGVVEEVLVEVAHRCKQEWAGLVRSTSKGTVSQGGSGWGKKTGVGDR